MNKLQFQTNLKCDGCIAAVTPFLNAVPGIEAFKVDIASADKTLTVHGEQLVAADIVAAFQQAGYTATPLQQKTSWLSKLTGQH